MKIINWFFKKKKKKKNLTFKDNVKEWFNALLFAVVAATLLRWMFIEAYVIPTPSMEKTLLVGDYLFVSKFHYGTRTPKTILQIPLTHQKIWGTEISSFLDWIQLPQFRFPGISEMKNNDIVVFNWPVDHYPIDLKTYYIKRCVAIAGDTLQIIDGNISINNDIQEAPQNYETSYFLFSEQRVNSRVLQRYDVTDYYNLPNGAIIHTHPENAEELEKLNFVSKVDRISYKEKARDGELFVKSNFFGWNIDNMGPLFIPKKGIEIPIDSTTISLYSTIIKNYEENENVEIGDSTIRINGEEIKNYTFKQNYYFMMGDNRHNSLDSRSWGFVPQDHILGKALFIWWSMNKAENLSLFESIRWDRIFNIIK